MRQSSDPPFLERASYRRRRLGDAARMLPVLGLVLFMLPLLWASDGTSSTARSGVYLFSAWAVLILLALILSRWLSRIVQTGDGSGPEGS